MPILFNIFLSSLNQKNFLFISWNILKIIICLAFAYDSIVITIIKSWNSVNHLHQSLFLNPFISAKKIFSTDISICIPTVASSLWKQENNIILFRNGCPSDIWIHHISRSHHAPVKNHDNIAEPIIKKTKVRIVKPAILIKITHFLLTRINEFPLIEFD